MVREAIHTLAYARRLACETNGVRQVMMAMTVGRIVHNAPYSRVCAMTSVKGMEIVLLERGEQVECWPKSVASTVKDIVHGLSELKLKKIDDGSSGDGGFYGSAAATDGSCGGG